MNEFIDIDILLTLAGCVSLTALFTEICKLYIKKRIDPKWYSLIFSAVFVTARQLFLIRDYSPGGWFMMSVNIFVCLFSSIGVFETIGKSLEKIISHNSTSDQ